MISTPGVSFGTRICDCCLLGGRVRIGLHHHDHDLAAGIAEAGNVVFLAVDHPFVADQFCGRRDILGVRRGDIRFGHGVGGADLAVQQRLQPLFFLLLGADALQHFHVAGIRRRAVHGLRRHRALAELGGDIGVVEISQAFAGLGIRQEEIPQADFLGPCLGFLQHLDLARRKAPAVGLLLAQPVKLRRHRVDRLANELPHMVVERPNLFGHAQIVEFVLRVQAVGRRAGHVGVFHVILPFAQARFFPVRPGLSARCRQCRRRGGPCTSRRGRPASRDRRGKRAKSPAKAAGFRAGRGGKHDKRHTTGDTKPLITIGIVIGAVEVGSHREERPGSPNRRLHKGYSRLLPQNRQIPASAYGGRQNRIQWKRKQKPTPSSRT